MRRVLTPWLLLVLLAVGCPEGWASEIEPGLIPSTHPSRRVERMLNPRRDAVMQPDRVVAALHLDPGQVVADIGSGPGYFTLRFAQAVGPTGLVYGVDIEPRFLSELARLAGEADLSNVIPLLTTPEAPGVPPASCDLVFFCSSYRHIEDRVRYLRRLQTCLKPGGRIAIVEWRKIATLQGEKRLAVRIGPPEKEKFDPEQVIHELKEAGFTVCESPEILELHYVLIAGVQN